MINNHFKQPKILKIFKKEKIKEAAITFDKEGALFYKSGLAWHGKN